MEIRGNPPDSLGVLEESCESQGLPENPRSSQRLREFSKTPKDSRRLPGTPWYFQKSLRIPWNSVGILETPWHPLGLPGKGLDYLGFLHNPSPSFEGPHTPNSQNKQGNCNMAHCRAMWPTAKAICSSAELSGPLQCHVAHEWIKSDVACVHLITFARPNAFVGRGKF